MFTYYPSFSVGPFGNNLIKNTKLNDLSLRFYSNEYPPELRHPHFLVTAGHFFKKDNIRELFGFDKDTSVMGDSGGFQIASGALKYSPEIVHKIFNWLEDNSDVAMNLDIPPRILYQNKYKECLDISKSNFKYFADHQTGKTTFLNVLQGDDENSYLNWYDNVCQFPFNGWGIGGAGGSLYRFMCGIMTLVENQEHLKKTVKYIHILGATKITDILILSQLQKSLDDIGCNIKVTVDSSTPSQRVAYGLYFINFDIKNCNFKSINIPKLRDEQWIEFFEKNKNKNFPFIKACQFDSILEKNISFLDVLKCDDQSSNAIILHNFYYYKEVMELLNSYVYSSEYLEEQLVTTDTFNVLKSIDEMVKAHLTSKSPFKIFQKYKPLYLKLSTYGQTQNNTNNFFQF
ncbi:MAG: hypothetical protein M0R17_09120 [Candidatus Omnitrophica bacterium]|jgi:hypothetical protein|nr:hypothetical protein [Candidatus Omnitrophota bacterium]